MNFKSILLALSFLFLFSSNIYAQDYYKYSGAISYLDGTPIDMSRTDIDHFAVDLVTAPDAYAGYVSDVKNGILSLSCLVNGNYILKFMGMEIARFEVSEVNDKDISNLPEQLRLPFNFLAITDPNQLIQIYDENINLVESIEADKNGNVALRGDEKYFSDKFLVVSSENGFPIINFFKPQKDANKGRFSSRKLKFHKAQKPIAKRGLLHNIQDDIYYVLQKTNFSSDKKKTIWLLKTFNAKQKKGSIHKLDFSNYKRATEVNLYLDETGRNVVVLKQPMGSSTKYEYQSLIVDENGGLKTDKNTFVYPAYRFKDNFVKGSRWIIYTFQGIALTEGGHNIRISCNGDWTEPNPAAKPRQELAGEIDELVNEINKAFNEGRDIGTSKSELLTEKREQLSKMPPAPPFSRTGSLVSNESFNVLLSPFSDLIWKMDSRLNTDNGNIDSVAYDVKCVETNPAVKTWTESKNKIISDNSLDPKSRQEAIANLGKMPTPSCLKYDSTAYYFKKRYKPSGYDPESELAKIDEIKDCIIEIDGNVFNYSYKDPYACKGIYMNADNDGYTDEERQKAMESCLRNATVIMGFEGEMENGYDGWGKGIDLFDKTWDLTSNQPINSWEGPYPELRYGFRETLGEYANMKEARLHCKSPKYNNRSKTYNCYDQKIVTVCLENYQYSVVDGRVETNYEALYCGEMEEEVDPSKGDEIVVIVSADGYITETRALSKRTLEASNILLSGHITDKSGVEIEGAQVKLRGIDGAAETDDAGIYNLIAKAQGNEAHSETMDIKLQKIGIEVSSEELGEYTDEPFGIVSDGFTTLKLKVKAKGIRPQTVIVKQPELGSFVEQSMLKIPLVLNADGEGEMEYVPPTYLKGEDLTIQWELKNDTANKFGLGTHIWVTEVPIEFTYEDEEGNPGSFTMMILVTRPPVFLIHGFTGNESTWADLGVYLSERKYESIIREYYEGPADESTIENQSQKIENYIQEIRKSYLDNGFLHTRIDIVAHSMGGLMSRHYISNMARYGEKVGVYIPYNVKLSREQLAVALNQSPVKLIDIRKLIMVGTPNHGATWIDGRIGHLGAFMGDVHEVANSQLRSNSQFLANLNAGENEGRHLDPNVQYALLYGIRRVSKRYPPDVIINSVINVNALIDRPLAFDDGVVAISSAKLNGVIDFPFPNNTSHYNKSFIHSSIAPYGFIHSPAMSWPFNGDASITTSKEIFVKVNELLLEDIPRVPLKNSFAKIVRNEGVVSKRYFSTKAWSPVPENSNIKLENGWCQFKTAEGHLTLGFFLDGHHWASLHIQPNTIVYYENASPEFVKVYLQQGNARFSSRKQGGGGFEVVMGDEGEKWYEFNPKAIVRDINTDFIIEEGENLNVQSINGKVLIGIPNEKAEEAIGKEINSRGGISLSQQGEISDSPLPENGWWSDIDTAFLADEVIQEIITPASNEIFTQNLLVNGSFEDGPNMNGYLTLREGATIPGWKITKETVDLTASYFKASDGERSIDLVGTPGLGAIEQIFQTTSGKKYQLTFDMAGNPVGGPPIKIMMVSVAGQSAEFEFDITGKTVQEMGWEEKFWVFTAISDQTNLTFRAMAGATSSNYGAAIDNIKVFAIGGEIASELSDSSTVIIPLQNLGDVEILANDEYLPISGFTHLLVNAKNDFGSALESPYEVKISLENPGLLPFIDITNPHGFIDNTGNYKYDITISEPDPEDFNSLNEIPLEAIFNVQILHPQTQEVEFEEKITLPLGMTLLYGQTIGPDYKPRQQPLPPEFKATNYQIANQTNENGDFYILFNTTLFDKDIVKFKKLAERTQQLFSMDQFDFYLQWSEACSLPLKYTLHDSIKQKLKSGQRLSIGQNGKIDLLNAEEHEQRIKRLISLFVEQMPLKPEKKMHVFTKLERLVFRYGISNIEVPSIIDNLSFNDVIDVPFSRKEYWSKDYVRNTDESSFGMIMHVLGHFLQHTICLTDHTYYNFLAQQCNGSKKLWTQQMDFKEAIFDKSEYISFNEAEADFFMHLIFKFIEQNDINFKTKSIYYNLGYLKQFENPANIIDVKRRFPAYNVSGAQTTFLCNYYGEASEKNPANVFADFLHTQMMYSKYTKGGNPAATINEWLVAKKMAYRQDAIVQTEDPIAIADVYGLVKKSGQIKLVPVSSLADASLDINGNIYTDFSQIPAVFIRSKANIKILKGKFRLIIPTEEDIQIAEMDASSHFKIGEDSSIELIIGHYDFHSPIHFRTPLASFSPRSNNFSIDLEDELTTIFVFEGELSLKSEVDEETISSGQRSTMNKKGKIKKPKEMKGQVLGLKAENIESVFLFQNK